MGIYIKGIKLPINCHECDAFGISDIVGLKCPCYDDMNKYHFVVGRPNDCPLNEVPTPHGRLIEEPKQVDYGGLAYISPDDVIGTAKYFLDQIRAMPTIIEADSTVMEG